MKEVAMTNEHKGSAPRDDAQLAAELEQAMNDASEWGEPIDEGRTQRSEKRQRAAMISIRLTPAELSAVQEAATALGLSVSRYVRESALRTAAPLKIANPLGLMLNSSTLENRATSMGALASSTPTVTAQPASTYYTNRLVSQ
jgi:predicted DNA binding CopG/RHH family protein